TFLVHVLPDPEAGALVPVNARTGPQPRLELDQPLIYEFATMAQHEKAAHTWRIKNVGQADLELWMEGKPTCSCTIAKLENNQKAVVKPGASTIIDLEWDTKEFHDSYSQGATFGTNDLDRPFFKLSVAGKVAPAVVVYPPEMITFPTASNQEMHRARIAVYSPDRPRMKLTSLTTSRPGLIVARAEPMTPQQVKQIKAEAGYTVTVELRPGMPQGRFHEELIIRTDHPKQ